MTSEFRHAGYIELDERRRGSFKKIIDQQYTRYKVFAAASGELRLVPLVEVDVYGKRQA